MGYCPLCNQPIKATRMGTKDVMMHECTNCGRFNVTWEAEQTLKKSFYIDQRPKLSAYFRYRTLRELPEVTLTEQKMKSEVNGSLLLTIDEVLSIFPKTVSERIDNMLVNFSKVSLYPGHYVEVKNHCYPLFYTQSTHPQEMLFVAKEAEKKGFIQIRSDGLPTEMLLTQSGWDRVATILKEKDDPSNKQAFIAMWFDSSMDQAAEVIKKAIPDAGYKAMRIDMAEHNEKICDRIIAEIRRSKFVVSDFTGHRGGVYFEAGFALGLGLPVIWTCKDDGIKDAHFDTRQYNHIVWKTEQELYERLLSRILATVI